MKNECFWYVDIIDRYFQFLRGHQWNQPCCSGATSNENENEQI